MEPEALLPLSQAPLTISCSESEESRASNHILFLQDFDYCSIYVCISYIIVSLQIFRKKVAQNIKVQWAAPLLSIEEVLVSIANQGPATSTEIFAATEFSQIFWARQPL